MYRLQMKFQRIISYLCLGSAALTFIYSLGVMTDVYFLYKLESLNFFIPGSEMFYDMQPFNKQFTAYALALIILGVSCLVFNNHTRRRYYVANYITTVLSSAANIGVAIWGLINVFKYRSLFLAVEFEVLQEIVDEVPPSIWERNGMDPANLAGPYSTFWFDISIFVFGLLILVSLFNLANMIFKTMLMSQEKALLEKGEE